jgi:hypothetical protein
VLLLEEAYGARDVTFPTDERKSRWHDAGQLRGWGCLRGGRCMQGCALRRTKCERIGQEINGQGLGGADSSLQHAHIVRAIACPFREVCLRQMGCSSKTLQKRAEDLIPHLPPSTPTPVEPCTSLYEKCTSQFVDAAIVSRHAKQRC